MSTDASCTLSELHLNVIKKIYSYLNSIDPQKWSKSSQVFYSPLSGFDNITKIWMKRNEVNNIEFPLCNITRLPDLSGENDISRRGWYADWRSSTVTVNNEVSVYEFLPVKVMYQMTIYDDSFNSMENFCQSLIFMRGKNISHDYHSDLINETLNLYITYDDLPSYDMIPEVDDRYSGRGVIYSLNMNFKVDGIIGINSGVKKQILDPILNVNIE